MTHGNDAVFEAYRFCRDEPLEPTDNRYVSFRRLDRLVNRITMAPDSPTQQLVTGMPGSGVSTELRNVKKQLKDAGFFVVLIDSSEYFDRSQSIDTGEFVALLVILLE